MAEAAAQQTDQQVAELCRLAFEAEHYSRFQEAFDQHGRAIVALNQLADDAKFLDRERKRVARKQVKYHTSRRLLMQQIQSGQKTGLDVVLPSSIGARDSLAALVNGRTSLSLDEVLLSKTLKPFHDQAQTTSPKGVVANPKNTIAIFLANAKAHPNIVNPEIQHVVTLGQDGATRSIPFYTPALDKSAPDTVFHVYISSENVFTSGRWYYFKVKDADERQTLYVLQGLKRRRYQVSQTVLSRATEFTSPCVQTIVNPVQSTGSSLDGGIGRQLTHYTSSPIPVVDKPDRNKHVLWTPRRFTWGGRNFVWKNGTSKFETVLCEVKREWPQPGSKTGKMLDECFEPLVHVQSKIALKKTSIITFKYGTGEDFLFRELVLASELTSSFVLAFGHDD
ncbi:unnamed protein product [Clonostachys rhizophaga]|uniref:Uncharacterized protein n=1 Tax=Clonostachys rhizophaga TaxID=160324 RepID=A0A9N9V8V3_9HYPO|nr:unnamed protein product [Clonostachys rhizophaga]